MKSKQQKDKFDHCEIVSQRTAYIDVDGLLRNSTHTLSFEIIQKKQIFYVIYIICESASICRG